MSEMVFQKSIMKSIKDLFHENTLFSIAGKAGTGKTSLSLFLIGDFLTSLIPYNGSCAWVQASEPFPKKRLCSMFRGDDEKLKYLTNNIFITPRSGPFTSYELQLEALKRLSENNYLLPPDLKFIVVDNISHHLRYKLSRIVDFTIRSNLINKFFETVLTPLIFRCHRENINLILIHEVSFNIESQQTRPFFANLYERIRGVHINLDKSLFSSQRIMDLAFNGRKISFNFNLNDTGFVFLR